MIKIVDVIKEYKVGKSVIRALNHVTCEFELGKFHALVGRSGSGKSTLLHLLGGLDKVTSGQIYINDIEVTHLKENELAHYRNSQIGFVFQDYNLEPNYSCIDNVILPMLPTNTPRNDRYIKAQELLKNVGLIQRANHKPIELSGGEKQRVAIARALINDPGVILADEPTGNLDSSNAKQIMRILRELADSGKTVILVTHNQEDTIFADNIVELRDGGILHKKEDSL